MGDAGLGEDMDGLGGVARERAVQVPAQRVQLLQVDVALLDMPASTQDGALVRLPLAAALAPARYLPRAGSCCSGCFPFVS